MTLSASASLVAWGFPDRKWGDGEMGGNQVISLIVGVECSTSSPLVEADMDSEQNRCTFRGRLGCHRPIEADGLCVMHLPKISSKEIDRLEPKERALAEDRTRKFSEELKIIAEHAPDLASFEGFRFPAIQADYDSAIEFLGLWEKLSNPDFKPLEFERFRSE